MSKSMPSSVTAEEAVARMVNMDYIPAGFSLEDMLSAFSEEAEVELENAKIDYLQAVKIEALNIRYLACKARESLAHLLLNDLRNEAHSNQDSQVVISQDSSSVPRYSLDSIASWVSIKYGIGIPEWSSDDSQPAANRNAPSDVTWDDIEIRIRKGNKIAYSHKKSEWTEMTFSEIGLLDRKKQEPNQLAGILIGLSWGVKFPPSITPDAKHKTAISKLRTSLKKLTGIESEPFFPINESDGWKPRFKLADDRKNADRRAKKAALHEEYEDSTNYDDEDDAAGKYLRGE